MRVGLFVTCLVDLIRPRIGFAALELLEAAGCEVVVPPTQTCCGQPGWNSGDRASARSLAERVIAEFEGFDYVVAPSGSCTGMIKRHYLKVFAGEGAWLARAEALAAKTFELTDFLASVIGLERVPGRYSGSITYHDSCAGLRELGIREQPRALLAKMPGVHLIEMKDAETCCGFGGTFSIKFGDISAAMAQTKCERIRASGAQAVVLGDLGCMLNIEGRLRRSGDETTRVLHVAEVLTAGT
ncbi:MAG: Fe-S oxidoreductase [Betaproteobacteria bacterium RIFCSPLOWO2_02_FULL_66_14]|nr:MAG: Fe-S oxidoreductase [Betaproteobacteria bacterium RIFCSPLOWO2_02_FULL_66_14]